MSKALNEEERANMDGLFEMKFPGITKDLDGKDYSMLFTGMVAGFEAAGGFDRKCENTRPEVSAALQYRRDHGDYTLPMAVENALYDMRKRIEAAKEQEKRCADKGLSTEGSKAIICTLEGCLEKFLKGLQVVGLVQDINRLAGIAVEIGKEETG